MQFYEENIVMTLVSTASKPITMDMNTKDIRREKIDLVDKPVAGELCLQDVWYNFVLHVDVMAIYIVRNCTQTPSNATGGPVERETQ